MEFIRSVLNPETFVNLGYIAIFLIVFAESGLFFGFFLPGDSLLLVAGVAAAAGQLDIRILIPLIFIAAIAGDQVGYWMGNTYGRKLFDRGNSSLFKKEYITRSEAFFAKYGQKTIILARFVPIVRTFTPILAGVGNMPYPVFLIYNVIGAILWGVGVTLAGYGLANTIPNLDQYLHLIIGVIILLSVVPVVLHFVREQKK
jgi:membrane-associated protein